MSVGCAVRDNEVCSSECSSDGCWGPADHQCLSCANFTYAERCVSSCDSLPDTYQSGSTTCSQCHPQCDGCTNSVCSMLLFSPLLSPLGGIVIRRVCW